MMKGYAFALSPFSVAEQKICLEQCCIYVSGRCCISTLVAGLG